jgi:hypothetical protein
MKAFHLEESVTDGRDFWITSDEGTPASPTALFPLVKRGGDDGFSFRLLKALVAFDDSAPKFVAFDQRIRRYRRNLH